MARTLTAWLAVAPFLALQTESDLLKTVPLLLLACWYGSSCRPQAKLVKERFGKTYPRRQWTKPLLIGLAGWAGYIVWCGIAIFLSAVMTGRNAAGLGNNRVQLRSTAPVSSGTRNAHKVLGAKNRPNTQDWQASPSQVSLLGAAPPAQLSQAQPSTRAPRPTVPSPLPPSLEHVLRIDPSERAEIRLIKEKVITAIRRKGPEDPDVAASLYALGFLYYEKGDHAKTELLFRHALTIREKGLGPEHRDTATSLILLASLYRAVGEYFKAEPLNQRAFEIREKALGPEHPDTASSLNNLALVYHAMGEHSKAEALYQRALKIREKILGPEHRNTANSLNNLAELYFALDDYSKAEPLHQRALKIREKNLGSEHPDTAQSVNNLAGLYYTTGEFAKAEPLYQRALRIKEKSLGRDHPSTAATLVNLAFLDIDLRKRTEALDLARKAQRSRLSTLANILSFTSERQRSAYQEAYINPHYLLATIGNSPETASALLCVKGVVLDSLLEDRLAAQVSRNPEQGALLDRLRAAKQRLTQLLLEMPKDFSPEARQRREAEKSKLATEVEELEGALARHVTSLGRARRALSVTVEQVQKAIPKQTVPLELLRYDHYLGANKWERRYGAIVLASTGEPRWVPLGSAQAIEKNVDAYQAAVRGGVVEERGAVDREGNETGRRGVGVWARGDPKSQIRNQKSEIRASPPCSKRFTSSSGLRLSRRCPRGPRPSSLVLTAR